MPVSFRLFFLFLCVAATCLPAAAQVEIVASYGPATVVAHHDFATRKLVLTHEAYPVYKWWRTDLATGENQLVDSIFSYQQISNIQFGDGGVFYTTQTYAPNGNDSYYYLNYLDTNGQQFVSAEIGSLVPGNTPAYPKDVSTLFQGKYYSVIRSGTDNYILQSDGTAAGTHVVCPMAGDLLNMQVLSNNLVIAVKDGTNVKLYRFVPAGSTLQLFHTFTGATNFSSFSYIGEDETNSYFTLELVAGYSSIWKTDLTTAGTQLFIDSLWGFDIRFTGNEFLLHISDGGEGFRCVKGTTADPQNYTPVAFDEPLVSPEVRVDRLLGNGYMRLLSNRSGIEVAQITSGGTIALVKDLNPGPAPGLPGTVAVINGYYDSPYPVAPGPDSSLYAMMTNGLDTNLYFYHIADTVLQSLFPVERPEEIVAVFAGDHYLFWFRRTVDELRLERYDLNLPPVVQQGIVEDSVETWFRQLAYPQAGYFWGGATGGDYAVSTKLDADGGVLVAFTLRYLWGRLLISSGEPAIDTLEGGTVLVKLDRYGKRKWICSLGDNDMTFLGDPKLETDSNGDIVLAGNYFQKAVFGSDSLVSPRSGYFLAKIDGTSGDILWKKKIAEAYYDNDIVTEGLVLDANDNIYLALLYDDYQIVVDGLSVTSPVGPVNAAARFSPDGTIQWLKNMRTPWTNDYGSTRFFGFDQVHEQLVAVQSQGYYNTFSSCNYQDWAYFIQTLGTDGALLDTFGFSGNDLGGLTAGCINAEGRFAGFGYYRDQLDLGLFHAASPPSSNCHANEGFYVEYDQGISGVLKAATSQDGSFYPLDAHRYGDHVYVYGTTADRELMIIKLKQNGEQVGYKLLGQRADPFDFQYNQRFDVRDSFLVFLGNNFVKNTGYEVRPVFTNAPSMSVLKIRDADWQTDMTWFGGLQLPALVGDGSLVLFPNPFTGKLTISSETDTFPYETFAIFDMDGRKMTEGTFSELAFQELQFGQLSAGMYLIQMTGNGNKRTERIVKTNQ